MKIKPMLAVNIADVGPLQYPVLVSPKIDGVRALIVNGVVMSRSMKPIPNKHVQALFGRPAFNGLDGELCVGPANARDVMQQTMSGVMSVDGEPDVNYHVFDNWSTGTDIASPWVFEDRHTSVKETVVRTCRLLPEGGLSAVLHVYVSGDEELRQAEASALEQGYEGIMVRTLDGGYKQGRCGKQQPWLVRVKRFVDAEAIVVGVEELQHNANEAFTDELGRTKRSTHQEGKRPAGVLGALVCELLPAAEQVLSWRDQNQTLPRGTRFNIGTGFTAEQRKSLWAEHTGSFLPQALVGRIVKFKHFAATGTKDAPRFPVFLGFRDERDL